MKRYAAIVGCYTILLLSALLPGQKIAAPSPASLANSPPLRIEARALWVKCETLSSPAAVVALVRRSQKNRFTDLVVQVRARGNAYYTSQIEPRADELASQPASFDPLALTIEEAHRVGIRVHAWINIFLVSSAVNLPKSPNHLINKHPEWVMVPLSLASELYSIDPKSPDYLKRVVEYSRARQGKELLEGLFVSPAIPEVRENIFQIWMDVARKYDVDGLHFDYVRYPSREFDYNRISLDRFRNEIEKNLDDKRRQDLQIQAQKNPAIYARIYPNRYQQFQRDQVTELVGRLSTEAKKLKPKLLISAAVFADNEVAARTRFQEWKLWLERGWLDIICPMAYTPDTDTFRSLILGAVKNSSGKQVWGGIGAYKLTTDSTLEKIRVTREVGTQGFILFSYDSSIKVSETNPQGNYLERVRDSIMVDSGTIAQ
jgi:uncharacterized lipoprotein YddW (UPF0748 family)